MKLIRFGELGKEKPGVEAGGKRLDLSSHFKDWNRAFFNGSGMTRLTAVLRDEGNSLPEAPSDARLGACVARPGNIVCVGLNYSDHAAEAGLKAPSEPVLFLKASNTISGPYDPVVIPKGSQKTDWEVELGVIIGKDALYIESEEKAEDYIAGYCVSHDVSEREFQIERQGQWTKGKSCPTFNPVGPYLVTPDEVGDVQSLGMQLKVNGVIRQYGNTRTMIFNVKHLVWYISQFMLLEAGDVITTGTPPGVGLGMKPPQYLRDGDVVELSIDKLGSQRQVFRAYGAA